MNDEDGTSHFPGDRYRRLLESSPDGIGIGSLDGTILEVNEAFCRLTGYSRDELTGMPIASLNTDMDPAERRRRIQRIVDEGSDTFQTQYRRKDGTLVPVELTVSHTPLDGGRLFAFVRDIRARLRSEILLRVRLELSLLSLRADVDKVMQAALDEAEAYTGATIGFYHFVDEDEENLTLTAWSTRTLSGMCTAEGRGSHYPISRAGVWVDAFHARKAVIHNDYANLPHRKGMPAGHAPVTREVVVPVLRNERVVAILGVGNKPVPFTEEDASFVEDLASAVYDIVERKRAEEALAASDRRFRSIVECASEGIWALDPTGATVFVNPAMCHILAMTPEELAGRAMEDIIHPDEWLDHQEQMVRRRQGEDAVYERRLVRPDGTVRLCLVSATSQSAPDGRFSGSFGLFTDITDMRQAEEALRSSELLLNHSQRLSKTGGWEYDLPSNRMTWTQETYRIHGLDPENMDGDGPAERHIHTSIQCYDPANRDKVMSAFRLCCTEGVPYDLEVPFTDLSGRRRWVRTMAEAVREDDVVTRVTGTLVDITERRTAEENYQALFRQLPDGFILSELRPGENGDGDHLHVLALNSSMQAMFALGDSRCMGCPLVELLPTLDPTVAQRLDAVAAAGQPASFTCRSGARGREFAVSAYRPAPRQVAAIFKDITDRRSAEEALQRRMGLLALTAELSTRFLATRLGDVDPVIQDSLASLGAHTNADRAFIVLRSEETRTWELRHAWQRKECGMQSLLPPFLRDGDFPWWLETLRTQGSLHIPDVALLPEEASREQQFLKEAGVRSCLALPLGSGKGLAGFIVFESLTASRTWSQEDQHVLRTAAGLIGSTLERRIIDSALESSESRYRNLVETSNDWVWEVDAQGRCTYASPKCLDLLGYRPDELVGRRPHEFMPPGQADSVQARMAEIVRAKRPFTGFVNTMIRKDGRPVMMETSGTPVLDPEGSLLGYRGVDRDVTARVIAERRTQAQAMVSKALAESTCLEEASRQVVEILCAAEGWKFGAMWTQDSLEGTLSCSGLSHHPDLRADSLVEATWNAVLRKGEGLPGRVWQSGAPLVVRDAAADRGYVRARQVEEAGLRSGLGVPLLHAGAVVGVLDFISDDLGVLDDGLLDSLVAIGRQVGQFVVRRRLQEDLQRVVRYGPAVIYALRPSGDQWCLAWVKQANSGREQSTLTFRLRHRDGHVVWIRDERRHIHGEDGHTLEIVGSWSDISERVRLEEQLRQSQKMEAVGRLAGGVAHDFNNLLTVINGYSELLQGSLDPADPNHGLLTDVRDAGARAAALTRQLLAFSRRQVLEPRIVDLGVVVRGLEKMLRRLIGEDVALAASLPPGLPKVCVDPGQLEQVVMNLAVNARDAMPGGGRLSIELRPAILDEDSAGSIPDGRPGRFVVLSVTDTGCGMDEAVLTRIFEPFFTTKELGKGTGLGLSTVFGIVQQSQGFIEVVSRVGVGTTFRVFLPVAGSPGTEGEGPVETVPLGGKERILLVEDDPMVREVTRRILVGAGYDVVPAGGPEAALTQMREEDGVDLLLSDVVMPGMSGPEMAQRMREDRPGLRVLFMSGYTDDALSRLNLAPGEMALLTKPFSAVDLTRRVREVLDMD